MSTAKPTTIILVHGAWHTSECFDLCRAPLEAAGYTVIARQSPSASNDPSTIAHTLEEDTAQLRDDIRAAAAVGRDVILVGHSYGGFLITAAAKGLVKGDDGLPGGVVQLVYICSLVPEAGPEPWALVPEILNPPWIKPVVSTLLVIVMRRWPAPPLDRRGDTHAYIPSTDADTRAGRTPRAVKRIRRRPTHLLQRPLPLRRRALDRKAPLPVGPRLPVCGRMGRLEAHPHGLSDLRARQRPDTRGSGAHDGEGGQVVDGGEVRGGA